MVESRFPMLFEKCPYYGSTETITQLAWAEEAEKGRVNKDTSVAAEHIQTPLIDPKKPIGISAGILMLHIDWCANTECGRRRLTKAEVGAAPVSMGPPPRQGSSGGFMPKGFG